MKRLCGLQKSRMPGGSGAFRRACCDMGRKPCLCKSAFAAPLPMSNGLRQTLAVCPGPDLPGAKKPPPEQNRREDTAGSKNLFCGFYDSFGIDSGSGTALFCRWGSRKNKGAETNPVKPALIASKGRKPDRYFLGL